METIYDYNNGRFTILANDLNVTYTQDGYSEYFHIYDINLLEFIRDFSMEYTGGNKTNYLKAELRISYNGTNWTNWIDLGRTNIDQPPFDPSKKHIFTVRITRVGNSPSRTLVLQKFSINGRIERKIVDGLSTVYVSNGETTIIKPPYTYKVFKITDMEVISSNNEDLFIEYRFSQTNGRTVSEWEPFTFENITTVKISPIRFFQIEYRVSSKTNREISIFDINIIGEFQNVSKDSKKSNLFGIRDNCSCLLMGMVDGTIIDIVQGNNYETLFPGVSGSEGSGTSYVSQSYRCPQTIGGTFPTMTEEQSAQLFNPYELTQSTDLINNLTESVALQFGHEVAYTVVDPDENSIDNTLHEYGLNQYTCVERMKVIVNNNQFPNDSMNMTAHDMLLFEQFEIYIVKTQFLAKFGPARRPRVGDLVWFCKLNQTFEVEHAQSTRTFNNYAIYYKVILKKYNAKSSYKGSNELMENIDEALINNSTLGELLTNQKASDKKNIANKDQHLPLTVDKFRHIMNASIYDFDILNSTTVVSQSHYDLGTSESSTAITYKGIVETVDVSDNISYTSWFNITNFNVVNNLFNYYDETTNQGIKFNITSNRFTANINQNEYQSLITPFLRLDVWYSIVINLDNRRKTLEVFLYKRDISYEEDAGMNSSTKLLLVWNKKINIETNEMDLSNTSASIISSNMKITNIRLFNDLLLEKKHNVLLNQNIIQEGSSNLIFADNANKKMKLMSFRFTEKDKDSPDIM